MTFLKAPASKRFLLCALFFIQAHAIALWYVPFSTILKANGLEAIIPLAFACSAIAALFSPMISGTLADRHIPAERVLRWLALGIATFLTLTFLAIQHRWGPGWVLAFLLCQHLFSAPTWGLASGIVLASLRDPQHEFGPVRVWGTFGWAVAGLFVSFILVADQSPRAGYCAAAVWLGVAAFTWCVPSVPPRATVGGHRWRDFLGLDALVLLQNRDHRAVFITSALLAIPLAAFYPYAIVHLGDVGEPRAAAAMSLGQVSEVAAMYLIGPLLARFGMRTLMIAGMSFGILRYGWLALDSHAWVLAGVALHGACFCLFYIPAQIYLEQRIEPAFRLRAQALLTVMTGGIGNLLGYLACGWWRATAIGWPVFWGGLAVAVAVVLGYFVATYRGRSRDLVI